MSIKISDHDPHESPKDIHGLLAGAMGQDTHGAILCDKARKDGPVKTHRLYHVGRKLVNDSEDLLDHLANSRGRTLSISLQLSNTDGWGLGISRDLVMLGPLTISFIPGDVMSLLGLAAMTTGALVYNSEMEKGGHG